MALKGNVNDKWLFFVVYPIMGLSIVHIGNDNSIAELLRIPSYYSDILIALAVTYTAGLFIRWLSHWLENRFPREDQLKPRLVYQLIYGLLLPVSFIVVVELIYLYLLGIPLRDSSIFYLELPLTTGFLIVINLIYFILYSRLRESALRSALEKKIMTREVVKEDYLVAIQGNQNVKVPNASIAYFILKDKLTFLLTTDNRRLIFDKPMKEVMDILPDDQFYRINRQLIASRSSIVRYSTTKTRRLQIELSPPTEQEVFLAKVKVSEFTDWFNRA